MKVKSENILICYNNPNDKKSLLRIVMSDIEKIFSDVLALNTEDKLRLADKILASLYPTNHGVDMVWEEEAEERISAYKEGNLPAVDEEELFAKYKS